MCVLTLSLGRVSKRDRHGYGSADIYVDDSYNSRSPLVSPNCSFDEDEQGMKRTIYFFMKVCVCLPLSLGRVSKRDSHNHSDDSSDPRSPLASLDLSSDEDDSSYEPFHLPTLSDLPSYNGTFNWPRSPIRPAYSDEEEQEEEEEEGMRTF